jgi:hypothetical protein
MGARILRGAMEGKGGIEKGGGYGGCQTKRAFRSEPYLLVREKLRSYPCEISAPSSQLSILPLRGNSDC